ncbi:hypothetical protein LK994_03765 [Ferruginibacter lapsinanis]|uniref:hypothetical protein n=1 Tax=Ferruginibacter lapsinanis TaxID=563172 RepID=UPI001E62A9A6|nr:hypothetical protein [Ferruginibacter lapsinanis]UEG50587.1 hypothetical protein LK994_03765 [Ferruginibacter lapsinanis]
MRKILYLSVLLFGGLIFNGCTKDSDIFTPDPGQITGPDDTWYTTVTAAMPVNLLRNSLTFTADKDSFDIVNTNYTVAFASGLECTFPGSPFVDNNGIVTTGKVQLESYLLKKKGDLIRMSKPTVSNNRMLISGGSVFIQAKKDGVKLKLGTDKKIKLHYTNDAYISSAMKLFNPDDVNPDPQLFNWLQCSDTLNGNNKVVPFSGGYDIYTNRLQWLNCNYFYNIGASDSVKISLTLPTNFTNANTVSYVISNDEVSVLGMSADVASKKFISSALPGGKSVRVISITKEGNFYYLGHNSFVTNKPSDGRYQNVNINPTRLSLEAIKDFLNNL